MLDLVNCSLFCARFYFQHAPIPLPMVVLWAQFLLSLTAASVDHAGDCASSPSTPDGSSKSNRAGNINQTSRSPKAGRAILASLVRPCIHQFDELNFILEISSQHLYRGSLRPECPVSSAIFDSATLFRCFMLHKSYGRFLLSLSVCTISSLLCRLLL